MDTRAKSPVSTAGKKPIEVTKPTRPESALRSLPRTSPPDFLVQAAFFARNHRHFIFLQELFISDRDLRRGSHERART